MTQIKHSIGGRHVAFEIWDVGASGILVDVLGELLQRPAEGNRLRWSIFDLEWVQEPNGILHAERVTARSQIRPGGLRLDEHGIRLFHEYTVQIINGTFFAADKHVEWPQSSAFRSAVVRSRIALQVVDSTYWYFSCSDGDFARAFAATFSDCRNRS